MASIGSIFVDLFLKTSNFDEKLSGTTRRLRGTRNDWKRELNAARSDFGAFGKQVDDAFASASRSLVGFGASLGAAFSVGQITQYSDTFKMLESRLGLVTSSTSELVQVQQQLFAIAQNTSQPLDEITNAYVKLNNALTETQKEQTDMVRVTDLLSKTLRISGTNAAGAATFFQQFGQAASSDFKAIGQELGTFADQNPIFYKILQDEARTYGKTLRQMAEDGELSFEFITNALMKSAGEIEQQNEQIAGTINQAWQKIDNAFLRYIGTSEQVNEASNSVVMAMNYIADNFDEAADLAIGLAVVYTARFIPAVLGATGALLSFSGAAGAVGTALTLLGGPVGLAVIAAYAAITVQSNAAAEADAKYAAVLQDITDITAGFATASTQARQIMVENAYMRIEAIEAEQQAMYELVKVYASGSDFMDTFRLARDTAASWFTGEKSPWKAIDEYAAATKSLAEAKKQVQELIDMGTSVNITGPSTSTPKAMSKQDIQSAEREAKKQAQEAQRQQEELNRTYDRNRTYIEGIDQATIRYKETQAELNNLYTEGEISLDEYAKAMQRVDEEYAESTKQANKWGFDMAELGKEAARNLQSSFADFLFDPFAEGIDGMLKGFIDVIRRMLAEAAAAAIIKAALNAFSGGTAGTASSFGGFFASGGVLNPGEWGIVGENGPEIIRAGVNGTQITPMSGAGNGGMGGMYIDARGADAGVEQRIETAISKLRGEIPGIAQRSVREATLRNPAFLGGGAR